MTLYQTCGLVFRLWVQQTCSLVQWGLKEKFSPWILAYPVMSLTRYYTFTMLTKTSGILVQKHQLVDCVTWLHYEYRNTLSMLFRLYHSEKSFKVKPVSRLYSYLCSGNCVTLVKQSNNMGWLNNRAFVCDAKCLILIRHQKPFNCNVDTAGWLKGKTCSSNRMWDKKYLIVKLGFLRVHLVKRAWCSAR